MNTIRIISKTLPWLMIVFLVTWLIHIKSEERSIYGSITIFLWGLSIIFDYLSKEPILITTSLEIPAGEYQKPERLLGLVAIISLSGCQTIPSSPTQPSLQKAIDVQPPLGKASLVLIRPMYITYGIRSLSVKINATPVIELSNKSHTVLHVSPGNHKIESEGGFLSWSKKEKMVEAQENQVTYVIWYIQDGLDGYADKVFNAQWEVVSKEVACNI